MVWYGMVLMCCVVLWHGHGHYTLIATRQVQVSYCMMCDQIATRKESKTKFFTSERDKKQTNEKPIAKRTRRSQRRVYVLLHVWLKLNRKLDRPLASIIAQIIFVHNFARQHNYCVVVPYERMLCRVV